MTITAATYELEVLIEAPRARVWNALIEESSTWWPKDFYTSDKTRKFTIEGHLGGRFFEDFGDGQGLVWYQVVGIERQKSLLLAGHLLPPFGGPAVTSLRLTLSDITNGTRLQVRDDRFGLLGGESPIEGWRHVFEVGLRSHIEGCCG